jgi:hypothetical protein
MRVATISVIAGITLPRPASAGVVSAGVAFAVAIGVTSTAVFAVTVMPQMSRKRAKTMHTMIPAWEVVPLVPA